MISFETRDDWSSATLTFDNGVDPVEVFSASVHDAKSLFDALVDWLASTFSDSASLAWSTTDDFGLRVTVTTSGSYTVTANAIAQSILAASASAGPSTSWSTSSATGIAGTLSTQLVALLGWWRDASAQGDGNGGGALLLPVPGAAARRPQLDVYLTAAQALRLATLALSFPIRRRAMVLDDNGNWRSIAFGALQRERVVGVRWRVRFEAFG